MNNKNYLVIINLTYRILELSCIPKCIESQITILVSGSIL